MSRRERSQLLAMKALGLLVWWVGLGGGIVIGGEMSGDVRNIVVSNGVFEGTEKGIRFKSNRERGGTGSNFSP